jgi:signal transduction histidine kinase
VAEKVIDIPTLKDTPADFLKLFEIGRAVSLESGDICFNFAKCKSLLPNAVAFIGGLARLIEFRGAKIFFDWNSLESDHVRSILAENNFAEAFNFPFQKRLKDAIPYREDRCVSVEGIMDYLADLWLGRGWVLLSSRLRNAITGRMWEIYNNAFEHSGTPIGVFSCGRHFARTNRLILSVVDFGQGIPAKVRCFLSMKDRRAEKLTDASCLKWAFQSGNSTFLGGVPRGLGLDLLREFVQLNEGKLEVYSNAGYAIIGENRESYKNCEGTFTGTMIHITLHCDESKYKFEDEIDPVF